VTRSLPFRTCDPVFVHILCFSDAQGEDISVACTCWRSCASEGKRLAASPAQHFAYVLRKYRSRREESEAIAREGDNVLHAFMNAVQAKLYISQIRRPGATNSLS
jgi:hypothetical protein